jgi:hypothetical protein
MKAYARHYTLKSLAFSKHWGWGQTNDFGKDGKAHLLEMRHEHLVDFAYGSSDRVKRAVRVSGSGLIANWYTITYKGFILLCNLWPNEPFLNKMKAELFDDVFVHNLSLAIKEIEPRFTKIV